MVCRSGGWLWVAGLLLVHLSLATLAMGCGQGLQSCSVFPPDNACSSNEVCAGPAIAVDGPGICRLRCSATADCPAENYCADGHACLPFGDCHSSANCSDRDNEYDNIACRALGGCVCEAEVPSDPPVVHHCR